jgi:curli biogenesis system outer membrane secretion channel CsgG
MKGIKYPLVAICVSMMLAFTAFGQATEKKGPYKAIEIEKFTVRQGVELADKDVDELMKATVSNFRASNRFDSVTMTGEAAAVDATPKLKVSGEVTKYVKGNRAARYLVGLGAGKTKLMVDVKLTDAATGEVVFHQVVDGDVTWGLFGGDSDKAKGGVADELIREMKKRGLAGDKKK